LYQLCPANGDTKNPLAIYHHKVFSEKSYIEILDRSVLDTLDLVISASTYILLTYRGPLVHQVLIVSFLIMEKRRRDD